MAGMNNTSIARLGGFGFFNINTFVRRYGVLVLTVRSGENMDTEEHTIDTHVTSHDAAFASRDE